MPLASRTKPSVGDSQSVLWERRLDKDDHLLPIPCSLCPKSASRSPRCVVGSQCCGYLRSNRIVRSRSVPLSWDGMLCRSISLSETILWSLSFSTDVSQTIAFLLGVDCRLVIQEIGL